MMIHSKGIKSMLATLVLLFFIVSCGSKESKEEKVFNPVGTWDYKVTTDVSRGQLTISGKPGAYKAKMTTEVFGTLEVMNISVQGTTLTADLDVGGTAAKLKCVFDGDDITGSVTAGEDKFPFEGGRSSD